MGLFSRRSNNIFEDDDFMRREVDAGQGQTSDYGEIVPDTAEQPCRRKPEYGIQDAIKLLRSVPKSDLDVVLTVVKQTLESMDVKVADIIQDAEIKEKGFNQLLSTLKAEVMDYQSKVTTKQQEIVTLEIVLKETIAVKNRLIYVENLTAVKAKIPVMNGQSTANAELLEKEEGEETSSTLDTQSADQNEEIKTQDRDQELSVTEVEDSGEESYAEYAPLKVKDYNISTTDKDDVEESDIGSEKKSTDNIQQDIPIEANDSETTEDLPVIDFDLDSKSVGDVLKEAITKSKSAIKAKVKSKRKSRKKSTA